MPTRHQDERRLSEAHAPASSLQRRARQAAQDPDRGGDQPGVDDDERRVPDRDPVRPGHRLVGAHHPVDDPRLAADLGGHPAGDQRDHRERPGDDTAR